MAPEQLGLRFGADESWRAFLALVNRVIERISTKEVAYAADIAPGALDNARFERERHSLRMRMIFTLLDMANPEEQRALVGFMAKQIGCELKEHEILTPAQKLERLERALERRLGPRLVEDVYEDAYGRKP